MRRFVARHLVSAMRPKRTLSGRERRTAGIIVIGDEILKGSTADTNSHFICKELHERGVVVKKISVVGDDVEDISNEVRLFSSSFDIVFTTGGVGPTHDDNTFIGLARAFNDDLHRSDEIVNAINKFIPTMKSPKKGIEDNSKSFIDKLATIPCSSTLLWGRSTTGVRSKFPVVKIGNVIAFPGVPQFCEKAFMDLQEQLFPPSEVERPFVKVLYSKRSEFSFSARLSEVAARLKDNVEIGSYPVLDNNYFMTKLIIESECPESGQRAVDDLSQILKDHLVFFDAEPTIGTVEKWERFKDRERAEHPEYVERLEQSAAIIDDILENEKYDDIVLSFNGGKDCTVLLHLLRIAVDRKYGPTMPLRGFHIMCEDQFPELSQFIIDVSRTYNIDMVEYPGPLKDGLVLLKNDRPDVKAVLMGSRSTDPKGRYMKSAVEWTDEDWPRVLRVCPILHWGYTDVWRTLRGLCIPYCQLYDKGYTSLGGRSTTTRNEALKVEQDGAVSYLPAYKLKEDHLERHGRSNL